MLSPEVLNYYQFQVAEDILQMNDEILFRTINTLNQPNMEPLDILICGLTMEQSKSYNKSVIQQYISSFITILANYPIIQAKCMPQAIIKQFYKKLQPNSLAEDMLNLELNNVTEAIQALHSKLSTKDIQQHENTRDLKYSGATDLFDSTRSKIRWEKCKLNTMPEKSKKLRHWRDKDFRFEEDEATPHLKKSKRFTTILKEKDVKIANKTITEQVNNKKDIEGLKELVLKTIKKL